MKDPEVFHYGTFQRFFLSFSFVKQIMNDTEVVHYGTDGYHSCVQEGLSGNSLIG